MSCTPELPLDQLRSSPCNHSDCGSEAGKNNALLYTLMANCRQQNLDPAVDLTEVFQRLSHHPTLDQAAALTPARLAAERLAAQAAEVA